MKKAAAFLLVSIMILISLTACAAGGSAGQQAEQPVDQPASVPESGVSQQPENDADKDNQDVGVFDFDKKTVLLNSGYEMQMMQIRIIKTWVFLPLTKRQFC